MFAPKSRWVASLILFAGLAFPTALNAHPGGGMGHGGNGHGGMNNGHGWHHGWGGWSWGVPWGWTWDYPSYWDNGNTAAWEQGYYTAQQQAQWAALQQQAAVNQQAAQPRRAAMAERANNPGPKTQPPHQARRPAPPIELTPGERAASKLKLAMLLADAGKNADAAEFCRDIVKQFPGTPAAKQAQAFLDKAK